MSSMDVADATGSEVISAPPPAQDPTRPVSPGRPPSRARTSSGSSAQSMRRWITHALSSGMSVLRCSLLRRPRNLGEGTVVVNAFVAGCHHGEARDTGVGAQPFGYPAGHVLDEYRVVVAVHGDLPFVDALEHGEDRTGRGRLGRVDEVLHPYRRLGGWLNLDGDVAALVVRAVIADGLAARADAGHGDTRADEQADIIAAGRRGKPALVVDQGTGPADRGAPPQEVREVQAQVDGGAAEPVLQRLEDAGDRPGRYLARVAVENLGEPAEVAALLFRRERDRQRHAGHRVLLALAGIEHRDRVTDPGDAHLVKPDPAVIGPVLHVRDHHRPSFG